MPESRTVHAVDQAEKSESRHLPLVDLLIDTRAELTELVVRSGMKVLEAMLEEDRVAVCGPRYARPASRSAWCARPVARAPRRAPSSSADARSRSAGPASALGPRRCRCRRS